MQNKNLIYKYNYIKKFYNFNINFKSYINFVYSRIVICVNNNFISFKLPSRLFFKNSEISKNIIFLTKFHYITFLKHLFNFYNSFFCYYYYILKLKGLGYRVFRVSKYLLKIFFNRSNFFYLHIPASVLLKYRTRRFFFIGVKYMF